MTQKELTAWIRELIQENKLYHFYKSKEWLELRQQVVREAHNECVKCKQKGIISSSCSIRPVTSGAGTEQDIRLSRSRTTEPVATVPPLP